MNIKIKYFLIFITGFLLILLTGLLASEANAAAYCGGLIRCDKLESGGYIDYYVPCQGNNELACLNYQDCRDPLGRFRESNCAWITGGGGGGGSGGGGGGSECSWDSSSQCYPANIGDPCGNGGTCQQLGNRIGDDGLPVCVCDEPQQDP
jgi:hypothetical protein